MPETITIIDDRTGKKVTVPITNGVFPASAVRELDPALFIYDPAYMQTAACKSSITYLDGDNGVLRRMGRQYTVEHYLERLGALRTAVPGLSLSTDVIVGFPTEDESAFENTLGTVERLGFTRVHVFPYSPRPGTSTAGDDPVPAEVKRARGARLRSLSFDLERQRWAAKLGSHDMVLVDRPGRGYGDDYTPFLVDAPIGELVRVRAVDVTQEGILARAT